MRKIFGPNREEVATGWRGLHNEEIHKLHASPNFINSLIKSNQGGSFGRGMCVSHIYKLFVGRTEQK
jgi:hypothetical protein